MMWLARQISGLLPAAVACWPLVALHAPWWAYVMLAVGLIGQVMVADYEAGVNAQVRWAKRIADAERLAYDHADDAKVANVLLGDALANRDVWKKRANDEADRLVKACSTLFEAQKAQRRAGRELRDCRTALVMARARADRMHDRSERLQAETLRLAKLADERGKQFAELSSNVADTIARLESMLGESLNREKRLKEQLYEARRPTIWGFPMKLFDPFGNGDRE